MIISRTPYRVSFFGGGTDYPRHYEKHGGACLVSAIDKFCYVTMRELPPFFEHKTRAVWSKVELVSKNIDIENPAIRSTLEYLDHLDIGYEIHHQGDLPARSGMGSSSAFVVGILNCLWAMSNQDAPPRDSLAKTAIRIESEYVGDVIGIQDQYAASNGGVTLLVINKRGEVHTSNIFGKSLDCLERKLLLIFTGLTRHASVIAASQVAEIDNHGILMAEMAEQAGHGADIAAGLAPLSDFPRLLNRAWELKRQLSPVISTPWIDQTVQGLKENGAQAVKLIGAGGGGFILCYVDECDREWLKTWAINKKLLPVSFKFAYNGSEIIFREAKPAYGR